MLEMGHEYIRFIRNDEHVAEDAEKQSQAITRGATTTCNVMAHGYKTGDDVYVTGAMGMREITQRWFSIFKVNTNQFRLRSQVDDSEIVSTNYGEYTSGGKAYKIYEVETPYAFGDLDQIKYTQSGDVITFVHPKYSVHELKRMGHEDWKLEEILFQAGGKYPICWGIRMSAPSGNANDAEHTYSIKLTGL